MFGSLGMTELLIILAIVILLFGARRIPELARGLGQGITEFKKAAKSTQDGGQDTAPSPKTVSKQEPQ